MILGTGSLVWNIINSQFELVYVGTSGFYQERYLLISDSFKIDENEFCECLNFLLGKITIDSFYQKFEGSILKRVKERLIIEYSEKDSKNHFLNYTVQTPEECIVELVDKIQNDLERYSELDFYLSSDKQKLIPMVEAVVPILKENFEKDKTTIPFVFYCSNETIKLFCEPSKMSYKERFDLAIEIIQTNLTSENFGKVYCENLLELLFISPKDTFNHLLGNKKLQKYIGYIIERDIIILNGETKPPHPETISEEEANYFDELLILMNSFHIKIQDLPIFKEISNNVNFKKEIVLSPKIFLERADYSYRVNLTGESILRAIQPFVEFFSDITINLEIHFTEKDISSIGKFFSKFLLGKCLDFVKELKWYQDNKELPGTINLNFNINHSLENEKDIDKFKNTISKFDKAVNLTLPTTVTGVEYKPKVLMKAKLECQKFEKISDYFNHSFYNDKVNLNTIFGKY